MLKDSCSFVANCRSTSIRPIVYLSSLPLSCADTEWQSYSRVKVVIRISQGGRQSLLKRRKIRLPPKARLNVYIIHEALASTCCFFRVKLQLKAWKFLRSLECRHLLLSIVLHVSPIRLVYTKEQVDHALPQRIFEVVVVVPTHRSDQLRNRVHEGLLILLQLRVVSNAASILHTDEVTHRIVHAHHRIEKR